jgi:tetratricopeptide (TPR) repeat protein
MSKAIVARLRHADHYLRQAQFYETFYRLHGGEGGSIGLSGWDTELANVRQAQQTVADLAGVNRLAADLCSEHLGTLALLTQFRQSPAERVRNCHAALQASRRLGNGHMELANLVALATAYRDQGKYDDAIEYADQALHLSRSSNSPSYEATALDAMAQSHMRCHRFDESLRCWALALEVYQKHSDSMGIADATRGTAEVHYRTGDTAGAIHGFREAIRLYEAVKRSGSEDAQDSKDDCAKTPQTYTVRLRDEATLDIRLAHAYERAGTACSRSGDFDSATHYLEKAIELFRERGAPEDERAAYGNLANAYSRMKEFAKAAALYENAIEVARANGDEIAEASSLGNLGMNCLLQADIPAAKPLFERSAELSGRNHRQLGEAIALGNLALCYHEMGEVAQAAEHYELAQKTMLQLGAHFERGRVLCGLSEAYLELGDTARAQALAREALAVVERTGNPQAGALRARLSALFGASLGQ